MSANPAGRAVNGVARKPVDTEAVASLRPVIDAYLASLRLPAAVGEDFAQETLLRVLEARARLTEATLAAYAIAVVRNVVRAHHRAVELENRHEHRLYEHPTVESPAEDILQQEEQEAVREAIEALPAATVTRLLAERSTGPSQSASQRAQLARDRARLRVEFVTRYRRVQLPTPRCEQVLHALSARDQRRQDTSDAASHLLDCPVCLDLAPVLVERKRRLAGVLPLPFLGVVRPGPRRVQVTGQGAAVCGVLVACGLAVPGAVMTARGIVPAAARTAVSATARPAQVLAIAAAGGPLQMSATSTSPPASARPEAPIGTVLFAPGSAALDPAAQEELDRDAATLMARGATTVRVSGYASSPGSAAGNARLSDARAQAVAAALRVRVGSGVTITVGADGERDPVTSNGTPTGRADNRRVAIAAS